MVTKFIQDRPVTVVAPVGGVTKDKPVYIDGLFGVPQAAEDAGELFALDTQGVYSLAKVASIALAIGPCYWDNDAGEIVPWETGIFAGLVTTAALAADTTVKVQLPGGAAALGAKRVHVFELDATSGLAIDDHLVGVDLPDNAVITRFYYEVLTTFTSATDAATIALGIETDDEAGLLAAVAISAGGDPFDAGFHDGIQDGDAANFAEKVAASGRQIKATVAVEALTAGKLMGYCEYFVSR